MIPRPPSSTLFPYTTLFRSFGPTKFAARVEASKIFAKELMHAQKIPTAEAGTFSDSNEALRDRKSTRLNSSHGYISYAVFCLKKKNKNHIRDLLEQLFPLAP